MYKGLTLEFMLSPRLFRNLLIFCHGKSKGLIHGQETAQYNRGKIEKKNSKDLLSSKTLNCTKDLIQW